MRRLASLALALAVVLLALVVPALAPAPVEAALTTRAGTCAAVNSLTFTPTSIIWNNENVTIKSTISGTALFNIQGISVPGEVLSGSQTATANLATGKFSVSGKYLIATPIGEFTITYNGRGSLDTGTASGSFIAKDASYPLGRAFQWSGPFQSAIVGYSLAFSSLTGGCSGVPLFLFI